MQYARVHARLWGSGLGGEKGLYNKHKKRRRDGSSNPDPDVAIVANNKARATCQPESTLGGMGGVGGGGRQGLDAGHNGNPKRSSHFNATRGSSGSGRRPRFE